MGAPGCPTPNKKGYRHRATAKRHLWQLLTKPTTKRRDWTRLHVYECPCGLFHVGHGRRKALR